MLKTTSLVPLHEPYKVYGMMINSKRLFENTKDVNTSVTIEDLKYDTGVGEMNGFERLYSSCDVGTCTITSGHPSLGLSGEGSEVLKSATEDVPASILYFFGSENIMLIRYNYYISFLSTFPRYIFYGT